MKTHYTGTEIKLMLESVGVPTHIYETTNLIYDDIIKYLESKSNNYLLRNNLITLKGEFKINEFVFNEIKINLYVSQDRSLGSTEITSLVQSSSIDEINNDPLIIKRLVYSPENNSIDFTILTPEMKVKCGDIENYLIKNRLELLSLLSHELKHIYDVEKNQ